MCYDARGPNDLWLIPIIIIVSLFFLWVVISTPSSFVVGTVAPGGGSSNHTTIWNKGDENTTRKLQITGANGYLVSVVIPD